MTAVSDLPNKSSVPPSPQAYRRKLAIRTVLSVGVGGLFVWFMRRAGFDVVPARADFAHVRWWTVGAYFVLYSAVHYFRAIRWDYLLRPITRIPTRRMIAIAFVGFLAILLLPFRMGEVARPFLVREKGKISRSAALGTIAAERVLDGLYVALLLAGALLLVPRLPLAGVKINGFDVSAIPKLGYLTVLLFSSALGALAFFLWKRSLAERLTRAVVGVVSPKLAEKLAGIVGGLADGLRSLPDPRLMGAFTLYSALYWGGNALTMVLLGWGCGLPMHPGQGFAVMGVLAMGILLPAAPGLFGAFQLSVFAALLMYFPAELVHHQGAVYVFLMYVLQLAVHVVFGLVPLATEDISLVEAFSGGAEHEDEKLPASPPAA